MKTKTTIKKKKMDKEKNEELRKELNEKKKILLTNVKDKHFGEKLVNDIN